MNNNVFTAKNTFGEGLIMDFAPDNTKNTLLTSALNATLVTFNGNEMSLQNDMGNGRVETAFLPEGYVPVGTCEFGDIIYIVSYNPILNKSQIGCFPSPERNISTEEIGGTGQSLNYTEFQVCDNDGNPTGELKASSIKKILYGNKNMNPGDKYIIYSNNLFNKEQNFKYLSDFGNKSYKHGDFPKLIKIHIVSIEESGKIVYLDSTTKWYESDNNCYYINSQKSDNDNTPDIDSYRNLLSSGYSIFSSKVSGKLALLIELEKITGFSCSWGIDSVKEESDKPKKPTEPSKEEYKLPNGDYDEQEYNSALNDYNKVLEEYNKALEDYQKKSNFLIYNNYKINWYINWTTSHNDINPSHIVLTESEWKDGKYRLWKLNKGVLELPNEFQTYTKETIPDGFYTKDKIISNKYYYKEIYNTYNPINNISYNKYLTSNYSTNLGELIQKFENEYKKIPYKVNFSKFNIENPEYGNEYYINCTNIKYNEGSEKYYTTNNLGEETELQSTQITDDIINNYFHYPIAKEFANFKIPIRQDFKIEDETGNSIIINKNPDISNLVYHYKIAPAMPYGILQEFEQEGYIDFGKIGKKDIKLNRWKYFNYDSTLTLNWGMNSYVEPGKGISEVVFEFYDNQGFVAAYHNKDKQSYNGNFTEYITLNGVGNNYKFNNIKADGSQVIHRGLGYSLPQNLNGSYTIPYNAIYESNEEFHQVSQKDGINLFKLNPEVEYTFKIKDDLDINSCESGYIIINDKEFKLQSCIIEQDSILKIKYNKKLFVQETVKFKLIFNNKSYEINATYNTPKSDNINLISENISISNNIILEKDKSHTFTYAGLKKFPYEDLEGLTIYLQDTNNNKIKVETASIDNNDKLTLKFNEDVNLKIISVGNTIIIEKDGLEEYFRFKYDNSNTNIPNNPSSDPNNYEIIYWNNDSGTIYSNCLYLVKIITKYCSINSLGEYSELGCETIEDYRWLWTNSMFNDYYYDTNDFNDLQFSLNLDGQSIFDGSNFKMDQVKYQSPNLNNIKISDNETDSSLSAIVQYVNLNNDTSKNKDNFTLNVIGGLQKDYNTFNLNQDKLNNIKVSIYLGKDKLSNSSNIEVKYSDSTLNNNKILPINNEQLTGKLPGINNNNKIDTSISSELYKHISGVTDENINSSGGELYTLYEINEGNVVYDYDGSPVIVNESNYEAYKNDFKLNYGSNSNESSKEEITYMSSVIQNYTTDICEKIETTLDQFYNNKHINLNLSGIHYSKYAYTTSQFQGNVLKSFVNSVSDLSNYNIGCYTTEEKINEEKYYKSTAYNNKILLLNIVDKGGINPECQVSKIGITYDGKFSIKDHSRIKSNRYDDNIYNRDVHTSLTSAFDSIENDFSFLFPIGYGGYYEAENGDEMDKKGGNILVHNQDDTGHKSPYFGGTEEKDIWDLGVRIDLENKNLQDQSGTLGACVNNTIEPGDHHGKGCIITGFTPIIMGYLTQLFYLSTSEKIDYYTPNNYTYLDNHYSIYERDIIIKLEISDLNEETTQNDLILMSKLQYKKYLESVLSNSKIDNNEKETLKKHPNVNVKLNSCLKTTPLQLQFEYKIPNIEVNENITLVRSPIIQVGNITSEQFQENTIYAWDNESKKFKDLRSINKLHKIENFEILNPDEIYNTSESIDEENISLNSIQNYNITSSTSNTTVQTDSSSNSRDDYQTLVDGNRIPGQSGVIGGGYPTNSENSGGNSSGNLIINNQKGSIKINLDENKNSFNLMKIGWNNVFEIKDYKLSFKQLPTSYSGYYKIRIWERDNNGFKNDRYLTKYKKELYYYGN